MSLPAPVRVGHETVKLRPLLLRAGDADVDVFIGNRPAAALRVFLKLARLHRGVLAIVRSAHASIDCYSHRPSAFIRKCAQLSRLLNAFCSIFSE